LRLQFGEQSLRDSKLRSLVKSVTWRVTGILILGAIAWWFTGSWAETTGITITFHSIRVVLYYFHERAWERVSWGRNSANPYKLEVIQSVKFNYEPNKQVKD